MNIFESDDEFNIMGRGKVITVKLPEGRNPKNVALKGHRVIIDGKLYLVRGVEMFKDCFTGTPKWPIGLLVTEMNKNCPACGSEEFQRVSAELGIEVYACNSCDRVYAVNRDIVEESEDDKCRYIVYEDTLVEVEPRRKGSSNVS